MAEMHKHPLHFATCSQPKLSSGVPRREKAVRNQNYPRELPEEKKSSAFSNTAKQVAAHNILQLSRTVLHIICYPCLSDCHFGEVPFLYSNYQGAGSSIEPLISLEIVTTKIYCFQG